ncbi:hypothetical protein AZI86_09535 [Bdellovibrio bacteriovorus]|uniref:DNA topoisomerase n=1 Tax=Bdellovibrio bacteriovorus TaxID=959 RepID=A0A150WSD8_BDEBC|nr:DNA topoisomerase IB [Bdellovibrio bacteriovorus]KYG67237.1 hypothetical protein AZI86_09535 [Bdellovibrio bacteriovorus]
MSEKNRGEAKKIGLKYVTDKEPGYTRKRTRHGFDYFNSAGKKITAAKTLLRIESLVIPPAWEKVWICSSPSGHLQCTGYDIKKRKQYLYHPDWSSQRNETKFDKLIQFGKLLPRIRQRIKKDLAKKKFTKEKVLAGIVALMQSTRIRIGNDFYAETNDSYGLTTMRNRHVKVEGPRMHFRFRGKSGVLHEMDLKDSTLSRIVKHCQELPGQELFAYEDEEGKVHDIGSEDVNNYLKSITGDQITAKDFRTWSGTVKALEILIGDEDLPKDAKEYFKTREVSTIKDVAKHLGNTVAICRKYYVHPLIFSADKKGDLYKTACSVKSVRKGLSKEECILLKLLQQA